MWKISKLHDFCLIYKLLCFAFSDVENEDEVIHSIQMRFKKLAVTERNPDDDLSDYGVDINQGPAVPSSDDIIKTSVSNSTDGMYTISDSPSLLNIVAKP